MSGMLDVSQQTDKPQDYRDQVFIGKVVVNDDIKRFHRIKVEIPDMWDGYTQCQLPWCIPANIGGGCGPNEYHQNIPETGSFVYVTFQNGDNHLPIYHGGVRDYQTLKGVLDTNYPHRIGGQVNSFKEVHSNTERKRQHDSKEAPTPYDRRGHHWFLDRMTNEVQYEHATKTRINIAPNGRVFVEVRERDLPDGGDFIMHTDRHFVLEVSAATNDGPPGHYYCNVHEDWWETTVENHVLLESRQDRMDLRARRTVRIESQEENIEIIAPNGNVTVSAGKNVTVSAAKNASVTAGQNLTASAGGNADVTAAGTLTLAAPTININGQVKINGNVVCSGTIVDSDGDGGA